MFSYSNNGCTVRTDGAVLIVENALTKRVFALKNGMLLTKYILDKETGYVFGRAEDESGSFDAEISVMFDDDSGRTKRHLMINVSSQDGFGRNVEHVLRLFDDSPFISVNRRVFGMPIKADIGKEQEFDGVEALYKSDESDTAVFDDICDVFSLPKAHLKAKSVRLFDKTDRNDTLVKEDEQLIYSRQNYTCEGNILILSDYISGVSLMVIKDAPTHLSSVGSCGVDFYIRSGLLSVVGTGFDGSIENGASLYGSIAGIGKTEDIEMLYKRYDNETALGDKNRRTFVMSNTWGDRSRDASLCEEFMLREIDIAHKLGVDIVQIDDGWQQGVSANSIRGAGAWSGYYDMDESFWAVNTERFPNGLKPLIDRANEYGIELGLWFGPDSSNDFENYKKDVHSILYLYRQYGIRHFKLDSVNFTKKLGEENFIALMKAVQEETKNDVVFNLDVTAQNRLGYVHEKNHGTIFVENRYTDWGNYYPHNTLKNLWMLSRYIPSRRLLFEVLNNKRNRDKYEGDPLAPINYPIDYEFASVMLSNPLIWMEMSGLESGDADALSKISKVYRMHRAALWDADINPIGNCPDGISFTGFEAICKDGSVYVLLLREKSGMEEYEYHLSKDVSGLNMSLLISNDENAQVSPMGKRIVFNCGKDFSYLFAKLS
ncbi:MAG: alpha-galactosidase [Clostridia bacterium]|nr:alpha-galactosidase [Clostridia bacterium]